MDEKNKKILNSNFKKYFKTNKSQLQKSIIVLYFRRFKEKLAKNKKLRIRLQFSLVMLSIVGFLIILPGNNLTFQTLLKNTYINNTFKYNERAYYSNKSIYNLKEFTNKLYYKIDYKIKNELYTKEAIQTDLDYIISFLQENGTYNEKLIIEITQALGLLINHISSKFVFLLVDKTFHAKLGNFIKLYENLYKIDTNSEKIKYNIDYVKFVKNTYLIFLNAHQIITIYSKNTELKYETHSSLNRMITKLDIDIVNLILNDYEQFFINIVKDFSNYKDLKLREIIKNTIVNIHNLAKEETLITLLSIKIFSNLIVNLLETEKKDNDQDFEFNRKICLEILEILKNYNNNILVKATLDKNEDVLEEIYRLKMLKENPKVIREIFIKDKLINL